MGNMVNVVGCYTLHLYCDFHTKSELVGISALGEFTGRNRSEAFKEARDAGWRTYPAQSLVKCPHCVKSKRTKREPA